MQLTLLGGAGLRTPLFIHGLAQSRFQVKFDKVVLFDDDEERISLLGPLNQYIVEQAGSPFELMYTTDIREALTGSDFVFSAIRVGQDNGRIHDERIALKHGVLGQETTGPGGFAMALRTIPVLLQYAKVMEEVAPSAWLLNFSNPAGIMTQALHQHSKVNVVGICDSPADLGRRLGQFLKVPHAELMVDYFGLNHLGFVRHVWYQGTDYLPQLLQRYEDLAKTSAEFSCFAPDLVRTLGMIPNEYLYYFYYAREAVQHILHSGETRGEQIRQLNTNLLQRLRELVPAKRLQEALRVYTETLGARRNTYMSREATGSVQSAGEPDEEVFAGGYEEVALQVIRGLTANDGPTAIVNVPNRGSIPELLAADVVEVTCRISQEGLRPSEIGEIPDEVKPLILAVKTYERFTVEAAVTGDYEAALKALMVHPLVPSYQVAKDMLDEYLEVHKVYLPQFS